MNAASFRALVSLVDTEKVSALRGKDILALLLDGSQDAPIDIAQSQGWLQDRNLERLRTSCQDVIKSHPAVVAKIEKGKPKLVKFFVGEVMKATKGQADPKLTLDILKELLNLDK